MGGQCQNIISSIPKITRKSKLDACGRTLVLL